MYDINVDDVKKAVKYHKLGKGDGEEGLFSDNIIHAPHILHVFICMLFKAMLVHWDQVCFNGCWYNDTDSKS